MNRCYTVIFNTPTGWVTIPGYGNIRRTALRATTRRLRDMGFDPTQCSVSSIAPRRKEKP